ncbi:glutamine-hydrolyzing GMP synthase [archaeon CG10_big_fil_rev_8_21_14_0_10_43_11]|nr:MAG: glutamine-hydrolyzing GMP synthase [archaeon CG10_big_fil_rev_8_21_14_0_10_43_11]
MILVFDFGSQVAHLITRRIRELGVYAELIAPDTPAQKIKDLEPQALILSGGPKSVYEKDAPTIDQNIFALGLPILGICYGHQLMAQSLGGSVQKGKGEYGSTIINVRDSSNLLKTFSHEHEVWMSHSDYVQTPPKGFLVTSLSRNGYISSMAHQKKQFYSVQFHPEVTHTKNGRDVFDAFLSSINAKRDWSLQDFIEQSMQSIKSRVGTKNVLMGVSGGVDSTVAATLLNKVIPNNLHCVFINNGLLREGEFEEVITYFNNFKNFHAIDASDRFLSQLKNVTDPEEKRKIIGNTFIDVFDKKAQELGDFTYLGQGTIYPDRVESAQTSKNASKIKTHHNVGGLPKNMRLSVLEPLADLYKDEVRAIGRLLGIPNQLIDRQPFPGPGLAVRIVGSITKDRLRIVRESDAILRAELITQGVPDLWQAFTALLPVKTVGVKGDERSYEYPVVIRCVRSVDAMTAEAACLSLTLLKQIGARIANEVSGVNRVLYDLTDKPPGTIEFE